MFLVICSLCLFVVVGANCFLFSQALHHFSAFDCETNIDLVYLYCCNKGFCKIISGSSLCFEVDEKPAFIVPLKDVSQATTGEVFRFIFVTSYFFSEWKKLIWNYYPFNLKYGRALNSKTVNSQVVDTSLQGLSKMIQNFVEIRVAAKSLLLGIFAR